LILAPFLRGTAIIPTNTSERVACPEAQGSCDQAFFFFFFFFFLDLFSLHEYIFAVHYRWL
jgi:hypothetical protein